MKKKRIKGKKNQLINKDQQHCNSGDNVEKKIDIKKEKSSE